jgi:glycosyltransferase involved in cell wall biosynthesis
MKIAYVTSFDVQDRADWARRLAGFGAAGYYFTRALERLGVRIAYVGPLYTKRQRLGTLKRRFYRRVLGTRYHPDLATSVYRSYARQVSRKLATLDVDIVLSQESGAIAYLDCAQPVVVWTDAPYAATIGAYDFVTGLCGETRRALQRMERAAVGRSALVMYASDWAAQAAMRAYGVDGTRVKVVPWGANLDVHPSRDEVERFIEARPQSPCKLVFCGLDWERKQGALTVAIAEALNRRGLVTELTLVGATPPRAAGLPPFVKRLGFIDMGTVEGRRRIDQAIAEAHFMLLPSRAETFGHVLGEASAFGVPCLVAAVGGMPTAIRDGLNGHLYPVDAGADVYADDILRLMQGRQRYRALARTSFDEFESRLSYDAVARTARALMEPLVRGDSRPPSIDAGRSAVGR